MSEVSKPSLRIVLDGPSIAPPESAPGGQRCACGAVCQIVLNVTHLQANQSWKQGLCAADFQNFRQWLAAIKYRRAQEAAERR